MKGETHVSLHISRIETYKLFSQVGWSVEPSRPWSSFVREIKEFISDGEDLLFLNVFGMMLPPSISHLLSRSNLNLLSDVPGRLGLFIIGCN